jgi:hypothetical protein
VTKKWAIHQSCCQIGQYILELGTPVAACSFSKKESADKKSIRGLFASWAEKLNQQFLGQHDISLSLFTNIPIKFCLIVSELTKMMMNGKLFV